MEILALRDRIDKLEAEVEKLKVGVFKRIEEFEEFLAKFEGGKKMTKKTKEA